MLDHLTVIDGTGAAPRPGHSVVIERGRIVALAPSATTAVPMGAGRESLRGHGVTCAGVGGGWRGPHPLDEFRRVIDVNLVGTFNCVRLIAQAMTANEPDIDGSFGTIVMVSSIAALEGQIGRGPPVAEDGE